MKKMRKPTAFLLALIIAFSAMAVTAAADGREPFTGREADCRIDFKAASVTVGEMVEMTAVGSYIDLFESDTVPVEGDIRLVPVKWTAKRADNGKVIDSGEWTDSRTVESGRIETADVELERGADPVAIVVEVVFAKQEYKDGEWETTGEYTGSNTIEVRTNSRNALAFLSTILKFLFTTSGRFGLAYVARAINVFIRTRVTSGNLFSEIIRAIAELFS